MKEKLLFAGIDVGSTTVKIAVIDPVTHELLFGKYVRHFARQAETVAEVLSLAHAALPDATFRVAVCGSGGEGIMDLIGGFFIQEVVANSIAIKALHKNTRVAIELGGQDAKVIFFHHDLKTGDIVTSDMRMNSCCAGGTGAFIDQVAELLHVKAEEFGPLAEAGTHVYDISGRCGVFAKTDIQPLLTQGVAKSDIALSAFHAIAKQVIGGLAQGLEIHPPVVFEGGPLTFNPTLIKVFSQRLNIANDQTIIPAHPELMVAIGTAMSVGIMFGHQKSHYLADRAQDRLLNHRQYRKGEARQTAQLYFADAAERAAFNKRHHVPAFVPPHLEAGTTVPVYIGIDAGSTTTKFVIIDNVGNPIETFYAHNTKAEPLRVVQAALIDIRNKYTAQGITLDVKGVGTTGYGELLFAKAFSADYHNVETVAHAEASLKFAPDASFILDIGGQDMKAINIRDGVVTGVIVNEACSSGCGSFIETFARSMGIAVGDVAESAFSSTQPSYLGSRCTVFMNSSVTTEQKNGKKPADIMAGICRSVIENVFTKVVRVPDLKMLGKVLFVQGGTFKNDAILRALEQFTNMKVVRAPLPGEMGALGIALLTKRETEMAYKETGVAPVSTFVGLAGLDSFEYTKQSNLICPYCTNSCNRSIVRFVNGTSYVMGNRCERGEQVEGADGTPPPPKPVTGKAKPVDLTILREKLLFADYALKAEKSRGIRLGIPRVLEFYHSMPFWRAFFGTLGFEVVLSGRSTMALLERGLSFVASDTICLPAKLAHGHIEDLVEKKVDRIFMPMMLKMPYENENPEAVHTCAVIQGYPMIINEMNEPMRRHGVTFDTPVFHWYNKELRNVMLVDYMQATYKIGKADVIAAVAAGDSASTSFISKMETAGDGVLAALDGTRNFAVLLAGRPYHYDSLVNHNLGRHFTSLGIPVLTIDSLRDVSAQDLTWTRPEIVNPFHARMYAAALYAAKHPNLEIAQIVSFGCGHDAIISEEMSRLLSDIAGKQLLILKLDEGEAKAPVTIRVKSFVETVRSRRNRVAGSPYTVVPPKDPFPRKFTKDDRTKTLLIPNLSQSFCKAMSAVFRKEGYVVRELPLAGDRAKELGKKYVHNDICYPAQINIGEAIAFIESGELDPKTIALGMGKNCKDCRAGHYAALARTALDSAGYADIPLFSTGEDTKGMNPGFKFSARTQVRSLWGIAMMDVLEEVRLRVRPYELEPGVTDRVFEAAVDDVAANLAVSWRKALKALKRAVVTFNAIAVNRTTRKPRVLITGEILLKYHPAANTDIVKYLERHDIEVVMPRMNSFFRKENLQLSTEAQVKAIRHPVLKGIYFSIFDKLFAFILSTVEKIARQFPLYEEPAEFHDLAKLVEPFMDKRLIIGEGWLIPAEIIENAKHGVNSFIIVQPFGCLPNHIVGRGLVKRLKRMFPHIQLLALDYDADMSFANIENRLQMLIITARDLEKFKSKQDAPAAVTAA